MEREKVYADQLLKAGKPVQVPVKGYSMYPLLVPGRDQVVVVPADQPPYKRGEVMLYRRDNGPLVLHRIWRHTKEGYYMVGDNQKETEGPLREDQMIGVMVSMIRKGRKIEVSHVGYRIYSAVWLFLRPVRPILSRMAAGVNRQGGAGWNESENGGN